eukprot:scaffold7029_cov375-Pinguiococcus_pyrenoidosus.AAC.13
MRSLSSVVLRSLYPRACLTSVTASAAFRPAEDASRLPATRFSCVQNGSWHRSTTVDVFSDVATFRVNSQTASRASSSAARISSSSEVSSPAEACDASLRMLARQSVRVFDGRSRLAGVKRSTLFNGRCQPHDRTRNVRRELGVNVSGRILMQAEATWGTRTRGRSPRCWAPARKRSRHASEGTNSCEATQGHWRGGTDRTRPSASTARARDSSRRHPERHTSRDSRRALSARPSLRALPARPPGSPRGACH